MSSHAVRAEREFAERTREIQQILTHRTHCTLHFEIDSHAEPTTSRSVQSKRESGGRSRFSLLSEFFQLFPNHPNQSSILVLFGFTQNFPGILLSESKTFLHTHLPLFIQLVYHWEMGEQLLQVALKQVALFLEDPEEIGGSEEASLIHLSMPVKKQRVTKFNQMKKNNNSNKNRKKAESETDANEGKNHSDISLSLDQSIDILEAVLNDTITQTSSYEKDIIANIVQSLKKVVVSLQNYLFASIESETSKRPQATLEAFFRLISLQFHVEMHINATKSLEKAKKNATNLSWIEKQSSNPLIGSIPNSMIELCTILRREILPLNETGRIQTFKLIDRLLLSFSSSSDSRSFHQMCFAFTLR